MKTVFTYLSLLMIPSALLAQPVENHGEFYHIGETLQMVNCDPGDITAGGAGANVSWDFSGLTASGPMYTETYTAETSSVFLTSNIVVNLQDGTKLHEQQNSTDTYLNGKEDGSGTVVYYTGYPISRRPLTYGTSYLDTFYKTVPSTGEHGAGYWTIAGDAYGTLKLPTGTFNNILRVRKHVAEVDSLGSGPSPAITTAYTTSYLWFDTGRYAPLLRIDSITSSTAAQTVTVRYIAGTSAVGNVNKQAMDFSANLRDNQLALRGRFETGITYDVTVYNIIGTEILKDVFATSTSEYRIDIAKDIPDGIYIVSLMQANEPSTKTVIKVIKQ